jgi:hypothetical protein
MAKNERAALSWIEIDPASLTSEQQAAYAGYKDQYRLMKVARERFEASMQVDAPHGKRLVMGYNFGKLSVAIDAAKVEAKTSKGTQTLAAFLATQAANGAQH